MPKRDANPTVLYLIRDGATEGGIGVKQAEATRDVLGIRPIDHCYSSSSLRSLQTATIVARPHGLEPIALESLAESDFSHWDRLDWQAIRVADPSGEVLVRLQARVMPVLDELLRRHQGASILVVSPYLVNLTYLAGLLGLSLSCGPLMQLDPCGISVVRSDGAKAAVSTLNAAFHLQGVAA